jgi:hypothetical protein
MVGEKVHTAQNFLIEDGFIRLLMKLFMMNIKKKKRLNYKRLENLILLNI